MTHSLHFAVWPKTHFNCLLHPNKWPRLETVRTQIWSELETYWAGGWDESKEAQWHSGQQRQSRKQRAVAGLAAACSSCSLDKGGSGDKRAKLLLAQQFGHKHQHRRARQWTRIWLPSILILTTWRKPLNLWMVPPTHCCSLHLLLSSPLRNLLMHSRRKQWKNLQCTVMRFTFTVCDMPRCVLQAPS